jgi:hypothetical protein
MQGKWKERRKVPMSQVFDTDKVEQDQTIKLVRWKIIWPEIKKFIEHYLHSCP